jgi:EAL domain-containing protein (putative c-di-GMP-specific phosphodiesterase class I)
MAIIRAIAGLGAALGIATTAEGVETEDQLRVVRAEGCTQVQGYLLGRPQPASTIPGLLLEFENKRSLAV